MKWRNNFLKIKKLYLEKLKAKNYMEENIKLKSIQKKRHIYIWLNCLIGYQEKNYVIESIEYLNMILQQSMISY